MYLCIYVSMYVCMYACMYVCMCVCMYVCICICICICICVCIIMYMYMYMDMYMYKYVYVCVSIYIYVNINICITLLYTCKIHMYVGCHRTSQGTVSTVQRNEKVWKCFRGHCVRLMLPKIWFLWNVFQRQLIFMHLFYYYYYYEYCCYFFKPLASWKSTPDRNLEDVCFSCF